MTISEATPAQVTASWIDIATVVPATVAKAWRGPCAKLLATIRLTLGPGTMISSTLARTKAA